MTGDVAPRTSFTQDVRLENLGTGTDNITFYASGQKAGWVFSISGIWSGSEGYLTYIPFYQDSRIPPSTGSEAVAYYPDLEEGPVNRVTIGLHRGQSVVVQVKVDIPVDARDHDIGITGIEAISSSTDVDEENDGASIELTVLVPDIAFTMGQGRDHLVKPGQTLMVDATVINNGLFMAEDVRVALTVSGELVRETTITLLQPGGSTGIRFELAVRADTNDVWLVIDPEDNIVETDEDNNRYQVGIILQTQEVSEEPEAEKAGGDDTSLLMVATILIGIVVASAAALLVMRSRAARARRDEEEAKKAAAPLVHAVPLGVGSKGQVPAGPALKPVLDVTGPQPLPVPVAMAQPKPAVPAPAAVPALAGNPDVPALPPMRMRPTAPEDATG
jgi:hypothetical protein